MSKLLDKAIAEVRKLPPEEQERIGAIILDELADEERWARSFREKPEILEAMVEEAMADVAKGNVVSMDEVLDVCARYKSPFP